MPMDTPTIRPPRTLSFRGLFWIASGQAVLWFFGNPWEIYWRSREFAADEYAVRLGQGPALANSLEQTSLPYERSIRNDALLTRLTPLHQAPHRQAPRLPTRPTPQKTTNENRQHNPSQAPRDSCRPHDDEDLERWRAASPSI